MIDCAPLSECTSACTMQIKKVQKMISRTICIPLWSHKSKDQGNKTTTNATLTDESSNIYRWNSPLTRICTFEWLNTGRDKVIKSINIKSTGSLGENSKTWRGRGRRWVILPHRLSTCLRNKFWRIIGFWCVLFLKNRKRNRPAYTELHIM